MAKKSSSALILNVRWQVAFIVVILVSFLTEVALIVHEYTGHGYIGRGTWTYQITTWSYPVLSALAGLVFALRRNRSWLQRIFWSVFLSTLSVTVLNVVLLIENQIRAAHNWFYVGNSPSYWLAFGWDWVIMAACFLMYCAGLTWLSRKGRR